MTTPAILYIEDDPLSRDVLRIMVMNVLGYRQIEIWEDSADLDTKLSRLPFSPDVIFVDIHMKPLDGFGTLKVIRKFPALEKVPVVALTASVMNEEVRMLRQAGFSGAV